MLRLTVVVLLNFIFFCLIRAETNLNTRIVGGSDADISQYPYQVSLQRNGAHFCGGVLYSNTTVITAAHCVNFLEANKIELVFGTSTWKAGGVRRRVKSLKIHPKFNPKTLTFDIAIIKLASPVTFGKGIRPINLALGEFKDNAQLWVSGWGYRSENATTSSPMLKAAAVPFISRTTCFSSKYVYTKSDLTESMICAGGNGRDSCYGDSGGPLVNKVTGRLVGIVSWGKTECGDVRSPGVYTYAKVLQKWILNTAQTL